MFISAHLEEPLLSRGARTEGSRKIYRRALEGSTSLRLGGCGFRVVRGNQRWNSCGRSKSPRRDDPRTSDILLFSIFHAVRLALHVAARSRISSLGSAEMGSHERSFGRRDDNRSHQHVGPSLHSRG